MIENLITIKYFGIRKFLKKRKHEVDLFKM